MNYICKICNAQLNTLRAFSYHLHKHTDITAENYYRKYINPNINNICKTCGNPTKFVGLGSGYRDFCSHQCQVSNKDIIKQAKQTKFNNYGEGHYFSETGRLNIQNTQKKIAKDRMKNTVKKLKNELNIPEEVEITNISQFQFIKDKKEENSIEKFGCVCTLHNPQIHQKTIQTNIEKYGVENPLQSHEIRKKAKKKFIYNDILFDSKWEIAYYIWLKDHNIQFEYQPKALSYEYNGKTKWYHPDFKIGNQLVEIKNPYLLENMKNKVNTQEHYKYMCMVKNNVTIINDCSQFITYIEENYGKNYLKNCKRVTGKKG